MRAIEREHGKAAAGAARRLPRGEWLLAGDVKLQGQGESRWGNEPIFGAEKKRCEDSDHRIAAQGCVITCLSMLATYYDAPTTPKEISDCLAAKGLNRNQQGTPTCSVAWEDAVQCMPGGVEYAFDRSARFEDAETAIDECTPLVAHLSDGRRDARGRRLYHHFALVVGRDLSKEGVKSLLLADPGGTGRYSRIGAGRRYKYVRRFIRLSPDPSQNRCNEPFVVASGL